MGILAKMGIFGHKTFKMTKNVKRNINKVGCVFPMVIIPILPQAEFGPDDHREDALHFRTKLTKFSFNNFDLK